MLMVKPVGAACNLRCGYCYYLRTGELFGGSTRRMSLNTLESLFAGFLPNAGDDVTIAWQGGEPTLAGRPFFEHALTFQERYRRPNQRVQNALQTNGTFLDDPWCRFLRQHRFLVGISIDGPRALHDAYRVGPDHEPSHIAVTRGLKNLKRFGVEHNILCVLHDQNVQHPRELWNAMIGLGERWLQFIPAIEWEHAPASSPDADATPRLAPYSPKPRAYGRFLCDTFDIWFGQYRDHVSVQLFDTVLSKLVLGRAPLCIHAEACTHQLTVEHNGDIFGCDHFVERAWQLGRIDAHDQDNLDRDWFARLNRTRFADFAHRKLDLPPECAACDYRPFCFGGCPKHRPHRGAVTERTILCEGYRMFFEHAMPRLQWLAEFIRHGMQPPPAQGDPRGKPRAPRSRVPAPPPQPATPKPHRPRFRR